MKTPMYGVALVVVAALAATASAQVFEGTGGAILDTGVGCGDPGSAPTTFGNIEVSGIVDAQDVEVELVGLNHTWAGDLEITVSGPGGFDTHLLDRPGADGSACGSLSDFIASNQYVWSNSGNTFPEAPADPIPSGKYFPTANFGSPSTALPTGDINGTWGLVIRDWSGADNGSLASWRISVTDIPEPATMSLLALGALTLVRRRR